MFSQEELELILAYAQHEVSELHKNMDQIYVEDHKPKTLENQKLVDGQRADFNESFRKWTGIMEKCRNQLAKL